MNLITGSARAKSEGKRWGGKKKGERSRLTKETLKAVDALRKTTKNKTAIARQLGLGRTTVYRAIEVLDEKQVINNHDSGSILQSKGSRSS